MATPRTDVGDDRSAANTPAPPVKPTQPVVRNQAIKRFDGEALTRRDIQHALMACLFNDKTRAFTNPRHASSSSGNPIFAGSDPGANVKAKMTFSELYIDSIVNSTKCSKVMREKLMENADYARDFAMVCLLVNVGRINTTLAFYPEMKTVLRSYHPIPVLQKSDISKRNLQDAPRMKSQLKGSILEHERIGVPNSLEEIIHLWKQGYRPPTSIINLIFVFAVSANFLSREHFALPHDFYTIFFPLPAHPVSSAERARAFLWLIYRYLEDPLGNKSNPFSAPPSEPLGELAEGATPPPHPVPPLHAQTPEEAAAENVDEEEEIEWGNRMRDSRAAFLVKLGEEEAGGVKVEGESADGSSVTGGVGGSGSGVGIGNAGGGGGSTSGGKRGKRKSAASAKGSASALSNAGNATNKRSRLSTGGRGRKGAAAKAAEEDGASMVSGSMSRRPSVSSTAMDVDDGGGYPSVLGLRPGASSGSGQAGAGARSHVAEDGVGSDSALPPEQQDGLPKALLEKREKEARVIRDSVRRRRQKEKHALSQGLTFHARDDDDKGRRQGELLLMAYERIKSGRDALVDSEDEAEIEDEPLDGCWEILRMLNVVRHARGGRDLTPPTREYSLSP